MSRKIPNPPPPSYNNRPNPPPRPPLKNGIGECKDCMRGAPVLQKILEELQWIREYIEKRLIK